MPEIGPTHPVTYRAETLAPVFALLPAGESVAVVASASMGKSRLVQFLLRDDVRQRLLRLGGIICYRLDHWGDEEWPPKEWASVQWG